MLASPQSGDNQLNCMGRFVIENGCPHNLLDMDTLILTPDEVVVKKHLRLLGVTGSHFATHLIEATGQLGCNWAVLSCNGVY